MTDYKDTIVQSAPSWLRGTVGSAILRSVGFNLDLLLIAAKNAVKQRFIEHASDDALSFLGSDSSITRYPSDSVTAFKDRIRNAWNTWVYAGIESTILSIPRYQSPESHSQLKVLS